MLIIIDIHCHDIVNDQH